MAYTIIRGGRVLDIRAGTAEPADILIEDDTIRELGPPGVPAPEGAREIAAARRLIHPGLVNAHTHSHGNLGKGMGDRWTLELLLAAAPWIGGNRTKDDLHLSAQIGAVEMVLKGCTALYDLFFEWPVPTSDGVAAVGSAYDEVGIRAVIAPMVADRTFYEAIPGLAEALPPSLQERVASLRLAPGATTLQAIRDALHGWRFDRDRIRPAVAPTIPHHCSDDFILGCAALSRDFDIGLHSHVAELKVQAVASLKVYGEHADRASRPARRHRAAFHGGARGLARSRRHGASRRQGRLGRAQSGQQHAARLAGWPIPGGCSIGGSISGSAPTGRRAPITRTCTRRCGSRRSFRKCRGRSGGAG